MSQPRGIRNNNPGNIRHGDNWQGMSKNQTDTAFVQFDDPVYGIRALAKVLHSYYYRHGLTTVREMIDRWAPPIENDTESYIQSVAKRLGVRTNESLSFDYHLPRMVHAIIKHENGQQPYSAEQIEHGIALA